MQYGSKQTDVGGKIIWLVVSKYHRTGVPIYGATENAGVENAGVENVAPECMLSCLCASRVKQFMTRII